MKFIITATMESKITNIKEKVYFTMVRSIWSTNLDLAFVFDNKENAEVCIIYMRLLDCEIKEIDETKSFE